MTTKHHWANTPVLHTVYVYNIYYISDSVTPVSILLHKGYTLYKSSYKRKFEDTKEVIGSRKSKYRQHNRQKKEVTTTHNVSDVISTFYIAITNSPREYRP